MNWLVFRKKYEEGVRFLFLFDIVGSIALASALTHT